MAPPSPSVTVERVVIAVLVGIIAFLWSPRSALYEGSEPVCPTTGTGSQQLGGLKDNCAAKPHHASWNSWWHPQRRSSNSSGESAGTRTEDWNILYHLGGNGPWVEKVDNVVDGGLAPPDRCVVEQVHMMSRHAERYPTLRAGTRMKALVERMKNSGVEFQGDLAFVKDWQLFWSDDSQLAQLTKTGPFAGSLGAYTTGVRLRTRYNHLVPKLGDKPWKLFASDSERVIHTANLVGVGFSGVNGVDEKPKPVVTVISEDKSQGANTLTPGNSCPNYLSDEEEGWAKGWKSMHKYRATYFPAVRERLRKQNPDIEFTDDELYAMKEMCGFETTVRGSSQWCDVFTREDFLHFEYARDVHHYYRAGPGNKYGAGLGWLWLNATTNVMLEGPEAGPLFFSFVHDTDISPMLTALDIINPKDHLPLTHIPHDSVWRKSQVSPMGGRIIFEVMACQMETRGWLGGRDRFVRININDGITALPGCDTGPGKSCRLSAFAARIKRKGDEVGDFKEMCGLEGPTVPDSITFLHQRDHDDM